MTNYILYAGNKISARYDYDASGKSILTIFRGLIQSEEQLIHGEFHETGEVTFINLINIYSDLDKAKYEVETVVIGKHFDNFLKTKINSANFQLEKECTWFKKQHLINDAPEGLNLKNIKPKDSLIMDTSEYSIKLLHRYSHSILKRQESFSFNSKELFKIEIKDSLDVFELLNILNEVRKFFLVVFNVPININKLYIDFDGSYFDYEIRTDEFQPIKAVSIQHNFDFDDCEELIPELLIQWKKLPNSIQLKERLFAARNFDKSRIEYSFLYACGSIESFFEYYISEDITHTLKEDRKAQKQLWREERKKSLESVIDPELNKKFKDLLNSRNIDILDDKLDVLKILFSRILPPSIEFDLFKANTRNTRNAIAHGGNMNKGFTSFDMVYAYYYIELALKAELLKRLNFPLKMLDVYLNKSSHKIISYYNRNSWRNGNEGGFFSKKH